MKTTIKDIETQFAVEKIRSGDLPVWPVLRMEIFYRLQQRVNLPANWRSRAMTILSFGYSLFFVGQMFKRCDILFACKSDDLKPFDGEWFSRFFYYLYKSFPGARLSSMILPKGNLRLVGKPSDPGFFFSGSLYLIARLISPLIPANLQGQDELARILEASHTDLSGARYVKKFLAYRLVFRWLLKTKKPKVLFLVDSYSLGHMALIFAAKELGIQVFEIQHGVVNTHHPAYQDYNGKLDRRYFPDYFICYSETIRTDLLKGFWTDSNKVLPLGNPYLSFLAAKGVKAAKTPPKVLVTLQEINEEAVVSFTRRAATLNPSFDFVLLPRFRENLERFKNLPRNMYVERDRDFYSTVGECAIHLTGSSTCAIEAPVFGVPNILYDHQGYASRYYGETLNESLGTYYVSRADEFAAAAEKCLQINRKELKEKFRTVNDPGFPKQIDQLTKIVSAKILNRPV